MYKIESLLHPGLIHFGIALVIFGWIFYFFTLFFRKNDLSFHKFSVFLLLLSGLGVLLAVMTGILFTGEYEGIDRDYQNIHMDLAHLTLFCISITCIIKLVAIVRYKNITALPWLTLIFYTFSVVLIVVTGYVGGNLAYGHLLNIH